MRSGCPWRLLSREFPPWHTVYRWFATWRDGGLFERVNQALVMMDHERSDREASPSASVIDSQSVKTTESGGPRGYDAAKRVMGRKRHALVATGDRVLMLVPHPANVQDRDGAGPVLRASRRSFPFIERLFAWLGRNRRLAKDFEATIASATALLYVASIMLLTRRLARS